MITLDRADGLAVEQCPVRMAWGLCDALCFLTVNGVSVKGAPGQRVLTTDGDRDMADVKAGDELVLYRAGVAVVEECVVRRGVLGLVGLCIFPYTVYIVSKSVLLRASL